MSLRLLVAATALLSASLGACAETLVLESASNGLYTYELNTDSNQTNFFPGEGIDLTGLAGVTAASVNGYDSDFYDISFTSDSVTLTEETPGGIGYVGFIDNFISVTSSAPEGLVSYDITGEPNASGTVPGPAATSVTPEPSSIVLLGTGLLGVAGVMRKRFA